MTTTQQNTFKNTDPSKQPAGATASVMHEVPSSEFSMRSLQSSLYHFIIKNKTLKNFNPELRF